MPNSDDLNMQSGPNLKSARKPIEQENDEFTHDRRNVIPLAYNLNCYNADEVFSNDTKQWEAGSSACFTVVGHKHR
jgi:hypothetical protein